MKLLLVSSLLLAASLGAQAPHWSFVRPVRPAVPAAGSAWARNEIDRFIATRLEREGMAPEGEADRRTLIRRVALDLTGLPPAPSDVDTFVASASPRAYEEMVERYLADPAYGERWATVWLDLARYADSRGFEKDSGRTIWPWRDWVVRALDADLAFDRFTLLQLAGDLVPGANDETRLATAFHRNTMTNDEGGTDDEEFRTLAVKDRSETTFQVWMGLTMNCARCHAHKYDPISTQDYYGAYAIFDQTADADRYDESPLIAVPDAAQRDELSRLTLEIEALRKNIASAERRAAKGERAPSIWSTWECSAAVAGAAFGVVPAELAWSATAGLADFKSHDLGAPAASAVFLRKRVECRETRTLRLAFGSDDGLCVWIDGAKKLERDVQRALKPAEDRVELEFSPGSHELLVQVTNGGGPSAIWFGVEAELANGIALELPAARLAELEAQHVNLLQSVARVPVLEELAIEKRRATRVHRRGNFLDPTDAAVPALPAAFRGDASEGAPPDRLALARWLTSSANPLTARVLANRLWARVFGRGIVETEEDFGTQGAPPTHPELLDWLAAELVRLEWSQKAFLRLLLHSATYRQSSEVDEGKLARDRWNRWLARGPRTRLTAEMVRDQALEVSGLLSRKHGGPPVFPPQPPGIWQVVYDAGDWAASTGEDRYRRALYTYWRRSSPYPTYQTLDAPTRDLCAPRRFGTITPLQALIAWNDPAFVEAAQALARRVAHEKEGDAIQRLRRAFLLASSREARPDELAALSSLYERRCEAWKADPEAARAFACDPLGPVEASRDVAELAALTACCSAILNSEACWVKS